MNLLRLFVCFAALAVTALAVNAQEKSAPAPAAAPKVQMTTYYFCLLTRGPNAGQGTDEERRAGQAAHIANIERLAAEGKILVAGPFVNGGEWRGLFILKCASLAEAKALVATDPLVQSGRLVADVRTWMTAAGYIRDPEFQMAP